jgi:hypothetical protein
VTLSEPWFERNPDRLRRELRDLAAAGATYAIDEEARAAGLLRLDPFEWPWRDGFLTLVAEFPDFFPYFRPEVKTKDLHLRKHQDPIHGTLCLLNRDSRNWRTDTTLARHLSERLPLVVTAATTEDPDLAASMEEHQGEPISDYLPYLPSAVIMVDGSWVIPPDVLGGDLVIGVDPSLPLAAGVLRGAVIEVRDPFGAVVCHGSGALGQLFRGRLTGRWTRVPKLPVAADPSVIIQAITNTTSAAKFGPSSLLGPNRVAILGLVFPEEVGYGKVKESWVFAVEVTS